MFAHDGVYVFGFCAGGGLVYGGLRSRARADDNGCALSAEMVILFNLSVEEATSIKDGTCLIRGCTTLTSGGGDPTSAPAEESEGEPEV